MIRPIILLDSKAALYAWIARGGYIALAYAGDVVKSSSEGLTL